MKEKPAGVRILSLDAKDLYLANHTEGKQDGYEIRKPDGTLRLRKFINTLDESIELRKLRDVYEKAYRNNRFSFWKNGFEYTTHVINVTFHYNVKQFNHLRPGVYVREGFDLETLVFHDHVCEKDGMLLAVETGVPVSSPVEAALTEGFFTFDGSCYQPGRIPTLQTVSQLRKELYEHGFVCDGIHYVRFKRSSGSARVGKCLFIDERLYRSMHRWECCGVKLKKGQPVDLAAWESYISLTTSSILDTLTILPENILLIEDYESVFTERAMETTIEGTWLSTKEAETEIRNNIFDGQSLMDISLFGKYSDKGMLLLRNRFFKSCCFNANLQLWFQENDITDVAQLHGVTRARSLDEIKLITTPSSIKYLKFGSFEQWLDQLEPEFGIVKHEKPTHYFGGRMVSTHYQLLNTLHLSEKDMKQFLSPSLDYLHRLKRDPAVVRYYVQYPAETVLPEGPLYSKNDMIFRLLGLNERFAETKAYHDFKGDLTRAFVKNLKKGHVLVHGTYATLLGNPLEMLLASIGRFDGHSRLGIGHVHSIGFSYHQTLLCSRSPHITLSNVWLPENVPDETLDRYLNLTPEILCINSIGESVLDRNSGSDFDSDALLCTDEPTLIKAARLHYDEFLVPVNHAASQKRKRKFTNAEKADLDIRTSTNKIGEIVNLSQELNSLLWDKMNHQAPADEIQEIYRDICQLDILSGIEIDKAKKEFVIDSTAELKKIRKKYHREDAKGRAIKPQFFAHIARSKGYYDPEKKNYQRHETSMDYLQKCVNSFQRTDNRNTQKKEFLPFSEILNKEDYSCSEVNYRQVEKIFSLLEETRLEINQIYASEQLDAAAKKQRADELRQKAADYIQNRKMNSSTMLYLLASCEKPEHRLTGRTALRLLFGCPNLDFYQLIKKSAQPVETLIEQEDGEIPIYGFRFTKRVLPYR
ncbi:hypothetical protein [Hominifimenecus sp. rT4P-3]|uniref:hypothetical protein n=1 Tax=Hominifimenecus sp. rT4P-3 TaxID=3242979 RepID=UPI003DA6656E